MGHILLEYLLHQGQYARVGVLFSGLYITRLIMGMGLMDPIQGAEKIIVPSTLGLEDMRLMGMIKRYRDEVYVMITATPEIAKGEGNAGEGSQHAQEP